MQNLQYIYTGTANTVVLQATVCSGSRNGSNSSISVTILVIVLSLPVVQEKQYFTLLYVHGVLWNDNKVG